MFVVQRMYRDVILPAEVDRCVVTGLLPAMRTVLGFTGYTTVDFDRGRFGTFTEFRDRTAAEVVCGASPGAIRSFLTDLIPAPPQSRIGAALHAKRLGGEAEFLVHRAYSGCPDMGELARRVGERLLPLHVSTPGLCAFCLLDMGDGQVVSLNLFDTLSHAETANVLVGPLVELHLPDLLPHPPETMIGRVLSDIRD